MFRTVYEESKEDAKSATGLQYYGEVAADVSKKRKEFKNKKWTNLLKQEIKTLTYSMDVKYPEDRLLLEQVAQYRIEQKMNDRGEENKMTKISLVSFGKEKSYENDDRASVTYFKNAKGENVSFRVRNASWKTTAETMLSNPGKALNNWWNALTYTPLI